jgi:hypothetical protein
MLNQRKKKYTKSQTKVYSYILNKLMMYDAVTTALFSNRTQRIQMGYTFLCKRMRYDLREKTPGKILPRGAKLFKLSLMFPLPPGFPD